MKLFLQILLGLGLIAFLVGAVLAFTRQSFLLSPHGYWRGAIGIWMLLIATKLTYLEKQ